MRAEQYSYFALKSATLPAAEITRRLGMEPDAVLVRGSKNPEADLPRLHAWKIVCRSTESVDDQLQRLLDRLKPVRDDLVLLTADPEVYAVMQVVRYFGDGPEDAPLGWHASPEVLGFLAEVRAALDVDEYDMH